MTDLKPCAHCGGDATTETYVMGAQVFCHKCRCVITGPELNFVIDKWNARADRPAGGLDLSGVPQGSYKSWRPLVSDDEWMVRVSDLQALQPKGVEITVEELETTLHSTPFTLRKDPEFGEIPQRSVRDCAQAIHTLIQSKMGGAV